MLGCLSSFFFQSEYISDIITFSDSERASFCSGLSALSGIILAVATFVCTALIQTNNYLFRKIREKYHTDLDRNIIVMIFFNLVAAIFPLFAIILKPKVLGLTIALFAMFLMIFETIRVMWWVKFVLSVNNAANNFEMPLETLSQRIRKLQQRRNYNDKIYVSAADSKALETEVN